MIDAVEKPAKLSFLEVEQLRAVQDPRRRLSIAMDLAEGAEVDLGYEKILHPPATNAAPTACDDDQPSREALKATAD